MEKKTREQNPNEKPEKPKKKKQKSIYKPNELAKEIEKYGYKYSLSSFWKMICLAIIAVLGISFYFELRIIFICMIAATVILILPRIILSVYGNLYEQKRFNDMSSYLEQMLYSFQKRPNILFCLKETLGVFPEGEIGNKIQEAIQIIMENDTTEVYEDAFKVIEDTFFCSRMKVIHNFFIKVELHGGEYMHTLEILLEDRRLWVERIYLFQAEKNKTKHNIILSVIIATIICSLISLISPEGMDIKGMIAGQIVTTMVLVADILICFLAQIKLSGTWFMEIKEGEPERIKKYYEMVVRPDKKQMRKKALIKSVVCATCGIVAYQATKNFVIMMVLFVFAIFLFKEPARKIKYATKVIRKEVNKVFPNWMMELALLLQSNNVFVAIATSLETAPTVLKEDIEKLLQDSQLQPGEITPYLNFLKELDIPNVTSTMRMLYAMDETGTGEAQTQVNSLIKRNNVLVDKAERLQIEEDLAIWGMLVYLPMLTSTVKMLVDMMLLLIALTAQTSI